MIKGTIKNITSQDIPEKNPDTFAIRVNPYLIKTAIDEGFLSELAFYYFLKHNFKYSRISPDNNPKDRITRLSGLSRPTVNKYLDKLDYLCLVRPDRGGYELASRRTRHIFRIKVNKDTTVSKIKRLLFLLVLHQEGMKQSFYSSLTNFIQDNNKSEKLSDNKGLNDSFTPHLSVRYISSKLNISFVTTTKLIHDLNYDGAIRTIFDGPEFVTTCRSSDVNYLAGLYNHKYTQGCGLYHVQPARHDFLVDPIKSRQMTLRRYRNAVKDPKIRKYVDELNLILTTELNLMLSN